MNKILLFLCVSFSIVIVTGCATTNKFQYVEETPWYQEINPAYPKSDWMILDVMPDPLEYDQGNLAAMKEETVFMLFE